MRRWLVASALGLAACQQSSFALNDGGFACGLAGFACTSSADCCTGLQCRQGACAFPIASASGDGGGPPCRTRGACQADGQCCGGFSCQQGDCAVCFRPGEACTPGQTPCCPGASCVANYCVFGWQNGCGHGGGGTSGSTGTSSAGTSSSSGGASSGSGGGTGGGDAGTGSDGGDAGCSCAQSCATAQGGYCLCDPQSNCVQCLSNADCSSFLPHCDTQPGDPAYGTCESCVTSADCDGGVCDPAVGCVPDCRAPGFPGCAQSGSWALCDPNDGLCVECLSAANCAGGLKCDPNTHACVSCVSWADCPYDLPGCRGGGCGRCATAADCPPHDGCSALGYCYCNDDLGCGGDVPVCVSPGGPAPGLPASGCGCSDSTQCCGAGLVCGPTVAGSPPSFSGSDSNGSCLPSCRVAGCSQGFCNPETGICDECRTDQDCIEGLCRGGACVVCTTDADCVSLDAGTPLCVSGACVGCLSWTQCPPSAPGCSSVELTCGSCVLNGDCPPGMGCFNGAQCVAFCGLQGVAQGCPACTSDADCEGATCDLSTGFCG